MNSGKDGLVILVPVPRKFPQEIHEQMVYMELEMKDSYQKPQMSCISFSSRVAERQSLNMS